MYMYDNGINSVTLDCFLKQSAFCNKDKGFTLKLYGHFIKMRIYTYSI